MCEIKLDTGGYKLKCTGKIVTPDNLNTLEKEEIQELLETKISAWEFLFLRKSNHDLGNSVNNLTSRMQLQIDDGIETNKNILVMLKEIQNSLYVELPSDKFNSNGINDTNKRKINDVIIDIWKLHEPERKRATTMSIINNYKFSLIIILGILLGISIKFHKYIDLMFNKIENILIIATSSAIILAVIGFVLKFFFRKKFGSDD